MLVTYLKLLSKRDLEVLRPDRTSIYISCPFMLLCSLSRSLIGRMENSMDAFTTFAFYRNFNFSITSAKTVVWVSFNPDTVFAVFFIHLYLKWSFLQSIQSTFKMNSYFKVAFSYYLVHFNNYTEQKYKFFFVFSLICHEMLSRGSLDKMIIAQGCLRLTPIKPCFHWTVRSSPDQSSLVCWGFPF